MRVWKASLIGAAVIAIAVAAAVKLAPAHIYALVDGIRHPIAETQQIQWSPGPAAAPAGKRPPNVILIVVDDLGINDISATGTGFANGAVPTPNIDRIAAEGANFQLGHSGSATCSPSRAALMTGRYPARFGFEFTAAPAVLAKKLAEPRKGYLHQPIYHPEHEAGMPDFEDMGMPASEVTIAEALKARGYHTMHIGKWHLGEAPGMRPEAQGFDESLGFMSAAAKYLPRDDPRVVDARLDYDPVDRLIWIALTDAVQWNGGQRFRPGEYLTDYFSRQAEAAIAANRNRPFFLYLAFNAPHTPYQALRSDYDALPMIKDRKARVYGAMLRALDRGIGRVLAQLKRQHIDENTMVILTSDNGGAWYAGLPDINRPYRGWKATFFEGGIRVPFLVRWPGRIAPGQRPIVPAHHLDIFATTAAATGAAMPTDRRMDSVNLLPFITGAAKKIPERTIVWRSGGYKAIKQGQWKLQATGRPNKVWLFDLSSDPTEKQNIASEHPEEVRHLLSEIAAFDRQMPPPAWPALIETPIRIDVPSDAPWKADQQYVYWSN
ncbi:MAG: sulfatase-like hydrolase/transferase [Sphingomicrobium sp.]